MTKAQLISIIVVLLSLFLLWAIYKPVDNYSGTALNADVVVYDVDTRSGLCFAATAVSGSGSSYAMAHVPCTDEVLDLVDPSKVRFAKRAD